MLSGLVAAFAGFLDFDAQKVVSDNIKFLFLQSIASTFLQYDARDTAETVATLTSLVVPMLLWLKFYCYCMKQRMVKDDCYGRKNKNSTTL